MTYHIAIASGKGGVGKTTAAAALGKALALRGQRVILVDMDLGLRNLDVVLGMDTRVFYHLEDVLRRRCSLGDALIRDTEAPLLALLPAVQDLDKHPVRPEELKPLLRQLELRADYVLYDCPAGVGPLVDAVLAVCRKGIVVTGCSITATRDADKLLHRMEEKGIRDRRLLINGVRPELVKEGKTDSPEQIADSLGVELLGVVYDEAEVIALGNAGRSLIDSGTRAGKAYMRMARRLLGEKIPIPSPEEPKKKGLFRR